MYSASYLKTWEGDWKECGLRLQPDIQVALHTHILLPVGGGEGWWQGGLQRPNLQTELPLFSCLVPLAVLVF